MKTFTQITELEMDDFLLPKGFKEMNLEGVGEKVYGKRVDQGGRPLSLRVYSSIGRDGRARRKGSDAIRVELYEWDPKRGKPVHIGHGRRVNRIGTWRKNLGKRISTVSEMIGPDCPNCGSSMILRSGSNGKFWGCSKYHDTGCSGTRSYDNE